MMSAIWAMLLVSVLVFVIPLIIMRGLDRKDKADRLRRDAEDADLRAREIVTASIVVPASVACYGEGPTSLRARAWVTITYDPN